MQNNETPKIDDHLGSFDLDKSGVPQSCVFLPMLFNFYSADMCIEISLHMVIYADDTFCIIHFLFSITSLVLLKFYSMMF